MQNYDGDSDEGYTRAFDVDYPRIEKSIVICYSYQKELRLICVERLCVIFIIRKTMSYT